MNAATETLLMKVEALREELAASEAVRELLATALTAVREEHSRTILLGHRALSLVEPALQHHEQLTLALKRADPRDSDSPLSRLRVWEHRVEALETAMRKVKAAADKAEYAWQIGEENRFTSTGWCTQLAALKEVADAALEGKPDE